MSTVFRTPLPPTTAGQHTVKLARSVYSGTIDRLFRLLGNRRPTRARFFGGDRENHP